MKLLAILLLVAGNLYLPTHCLSADEDDDSSAVPLNKSGTVLIDKQNGRLLLKTEVCLREGVLEMLLCTSQTKEHESIVTIDAKAQVIHAGLLALGAKPGSPVQFQPQFRPPRGQQIAIFMNWVDENGKSHRERAQTWIRHRTFRYFEEPLKTVPTGVVLDVGDNSLRYDKMNELLLWYGTMSKEKREELLKMSSDEAYQKVIHKMFRDSQPIEMKADFVFAGSGFSKLDDGTVYYKAEGGSVICVANFSDAMIDVDIKSSASDAAGRSFEPYTERIPPLDTPVTIELIPVPKKKAEDSSSKDE